MEVREFKQNGLQRYTCSKPLLWPVSVEVSVRVSVGEGVDRCGHLRWMVSPVRI